MEINGEAVVHDELLPTRLHKGKSPVRETHMHGHTREQPLPTRPHKGKSLVRGDVHMQTHTTTTRAYQTAQGQIASQGDTTEQHIKDPKHGDTCLEMYGEPWPITPPDTPNCRPDDCKTASFTKTETYSGENRSSASSIVISFVRQNRGRMQLELVGNCTRHVLLLLWYGAGTRNETMGNWLVCLTHYPTHMIPTPQNIANYSFPGHEFMLSMTNKL